MTNQGGPAAIESQLVTAKYVSLIYVENECLASPIQFIRIYNVNEVLNKIIG